MAIIWSSKSVQEAIDKLRFVPGDKINMGCFHDRRTNLKAGYITFQLTHEELEEYTKCAGNVVYFVSTYCKFLTDKGLSTVKLRDFQEDILSTLGEEEWLEDLEEFGPKNRDFVLMAARQVGKCFLENSYIYIKNKKTNKTFKIKIGDFYNLIRYTTYKNKKLFLTKIKIFLYNIYDKL